MPLIDRGLKSPHCRSRRRTLVILVVVSSLVTTIALFGQQDAVDKGHRIGAIPLSADLELGVYTDKHVYAPGELVNITLWAKNVGDEPRTVTFTGLPQVWYDIYAQNGSAVCTFNHLFLWVMSYETILPNETYTWDLAWPQVTYVWTNETYTNFEQVPWPAYYEIFIGNIGGLPEVDPVWVAVTDVSLCSAEFSVTSDQPLPGAPVDFEASESLNSIGGNESLQYRWDWDGDGSWDTDWTSQTVTNHTFATDGVYPVILEIRDLSGEDASVRHLVTVGSPAVPEFGSVAVPAVGVAAVFLAFLAGRRKR